MEKVWAKTNGNYENINSGSPVEVYDFLFGAPAKQYIFKNSPINYANTTSSLASAGTVIWGLLG